ncbi:hypothetical protein [Marinicella sp. W31]|uniref:hypothetical protein n=1 Tax=Marinicella sp. W31 TaxID=3023713 RepID=UPI00375733A6
MKNSIKVLCLLSAVSFSAGAVDVGSQFNYQGQLKESGSAASGQYDIQFKLYDAESNGNQVQSTQFKDDVEVEDGLFKVDLDFSDLPFFGEDRWLQIEVRDGASNGAFTVLTPRQRINAVPYSIQSEFVKDGNVFSSSLDDMGASNGQVLTYNGGSWGPANGGAGGSVWAESGSNISYTAGNVGIGTATPNAPLAISSTAVVPMRVNGGTNMFIPFSEQNSQRGYIGSFQTGPGTNDEDFELGTISGSAGHLHLVTGNNEPRLTVSDEGNVGVGLTTPAGKFQIDSDASTSEALRVRIDSATKFYVDANGGSSVGTFSTPPADGLRVNGDVKQSLSSGGMMKYSVLIDCTSTPTIERFYNGVSSGTVTAVAGSAGGKCIIDFPTDIDTRFWQASAVFAFTSSNTGTRGATCRLNTGQTDQLLCERFNASTGALSIGQIMVTVY